MLACLTRALLEVADLATARAHIATLQDDLTKVQRENASLRHQLDVLCQRGRILRSGRWIGMVRTSTATAPTWKNGILSSRALDDFSRLQRRLYVRTIKPVAYTNRAPHIHFAVKMKGRDDFTTQCYIQRTRDRLKRLTADWTRRRLRMTAPRVSPYVSRTEFRRTEMQLSNPARGLNFRDAARPILERDLGVRLSPEVSLPIGKPSKLHKFDLVAEDRTWVLECKALEWRENGGVPQAKITSITEAALCLRDFVHQGSRRAIILSRATHSKRRETLAAYYGVCTATIWPAR